MKKLLFIAVLAMIMLAFSGCGQEHIHEHIFSKATCLEPQTCLECGMTNGTALGHAWKDATCQAPKTCERCGETQGDILEHDVTEGKCSMCGLDYYEELVSLIKKYGVYKRETSGSEVFESYDIRKDNVGIYEWVIWSYSLTKDRVSGGAQVMKKSDKEFDSFYIRFSDYGIKEQKYEWEFTAYDFRDENWRQKISGQIYAPDYSPDTIALVYSNSSFVNSSQAYYAAKDGAKMLDATIELLFELLAKSEYDLTPAHYGFK